MPIAYSRIGISPDPWFWNSLEGSWVIENYLSLIVLSKLECSLASFLCAAGTEFSTLFWMPYIYIHNAACYVEGTGKSHVICFFIALLLHICGKKTPLVLNYWSVTKKIVDLCWLTWQLIKWEKHNNYVYMFHFWLFWLVWLERNNKLTMVDVGR